MRPTLCWYAQRMDDFAKRTVTQALDVAIAEVAEEEFTKLSRELGDDEIAERIGRALGSMRRLSQDRKPEYDEWDALFYSLWFHPGQVNLAYALARSIPSPENPLLQGKGKLDLIDFGCGALAMRCGVYLASMDSVAEHGSLPKVQFDERDDSKAMKDIGAAIYKKFWEDVQGKSEIVVEGKTRKVDEGGPTKKWLTALHVAYRENADSVKIILGEIVEHDRPNLVAVTCHEMSRNDVYKPPPAKFSEVELADPKGGDLLAGSAAFGNLTKVTAFRRKLATDYPQVKNKWLLTEKPSTWDNNLGKSLRFCYIRDDGHA